MIERNVKWYMIFSLQFVWRMPCMDKRDKKRWTSLFPIRMQTFEITVQQKYQDVVHNNLGNKTIRASDANTKFQSWFLWWVFFYNLWVDVTADKVFILHRYQQPSSQQFCVEVNYHWYVHYFNYLFTKHSFFLILRPFYLMNRLSKLYVAKLLQNFWSSMLVNFLLYLAFLNFLIRASLVSLLWTKYKISVLVSISLLILRQLQELLFESKCFFT